MNLLKYRFIEKEYPISGLLPNTNELNLQLVAQFGAGMLDPVPQFPPE